MLKLIGSLPNSERIVPIFRRETEGDHAIDRQPGAMHPRASETPSDPG
jgi:hypothetical protein